MQVCFLNCKCDCSFRSLPYSCPSKLGIKRFKELHSRESQRVHVVIEGSTKGALISGQRKRWREFKSNLKGETFSERDREFKKNFYTNQYHGKRERERIVSMNDDLLKRRAKELEGEKDDERKDARERENKERKKEMFRFLEIDIKYSLSLSLYSWL